MLERSMNSHLLIESLSVFFRCPLGDVDELAGSRASFVYAGSFENALNSLGT